MDESFISLEDSHKNGGHIFVENALDLLIQATTQHRYKEMETTPHVKSCNRCHAPLPAGSNERYCDKACELK